MKLIQVNAYEIAFLFRKGLLVKTLHMGNHWIELRDQLTYHDLTLPLESDRDFCTLLDNNHVADRLKVFQIKDGEIGIEKRNGIFNRILVPGTYGYWNVLIQYDIKVLNLNESEINSDTTEKILMKSELGDSYL